MVHGEGMNDSTPTTPNTVVDAPAPGRRHGAARKIACISAVVWLITSLLLAPLGDYELSAVMELDYYGDDYQGLSYLQQVALSVTPLVRQLMDFAGIVALVAVSVVALRFVRDRRAAAAPVEA